MGNSLAVAYGMKKKAKKMASGGCVGDSCPGCSTCMAEGGEAAYKSGYGSRDQDFQEGVHSQTARSPSGQSSAGRLAREGKTEMSKSLHRENLKELKGMKKPNLMAEGGEVEMRTDDLVDRIMSKRTNCEGESCEGCMSAHCMTEGGKVANQMGVQADELPAEYDDLALRDDLSFHDTGANSGDELGNASQDEDRHDIVARIMRQRKMKQSNPRPA